MARPAGVPNKPKRALLRLLQEKYPGYHPVLSMAEIANNPDNDVTLRAQMHKEVARYVEPLLQAVSIGNDVDGGPVKLVIEWTSAA
jgi:hypothetical protein